MQAFLDSLSYILIGVTSVNMEQFNIPGSGAVESGVRQ